MLYHLSHYFQGHIHALNVIHYVSFRAIAALLTSLLFSFVFGNFFIEKSKQFFRSKARDWTPESHKAKDNMPTMGGIFIISNVLFSTLLWANLAKPTVGLMLLCLLSYGAIGFWDDWNKIRKVKGISARQKSLLQVG